MYSSSDEIGIITAYVEQLEKESIPYALTIKKRVSAGDTLNEIEIMHFEQLLSEARMMMPMLKHHSEYQKLIAELASLYHEISEEALRNELNKKK
ncbi:MULTISPECIES: hypothetical protein [Methylomonas]|uniref:Uncharacterized protein n=1 Tax=Methylomonas koyamae TaxID=702114 RepID=A0A177NPK2_9GAMM|nr:hypothetical protein [Methylomonas koyamae]NJA06339.1 hypothetical protein [Methylococcaceae bacterium WWC4]OAI19987.1 hypothetical protein A1355_03305 [Methylomonas koyamae]